MTHSEVAKVKKIIKHLSSAAIIADEVELYLDNGGDVGSLIGSLRNELENKLANLPADSR